MAEVITPANEIVVIGHATGKSNAADFLKEYLKTHHPDISRRVIATESADLSAVTEPEIEALAKRHMIPIVERRSSYPQSSPQKIALPRARICPARSQPSTCQESCRH